MNHLLCFGFGFSAKTLAKQLDPKLWRVTGTSRTEEGAKAITAQGFEGVVFDELQNIPETVTHILVSVPPDNRGDVVLAKFGKEIIARAKSIEWLGYLSTTGVYGDRAGAWVDEDAALTPNTDRGHKRVLAETQWQSITLLPLHIFRLAGIYGPGRNALEMVKSGRAQRVIKPGQIFSRIHVEDIAGVLLASIAGPDPQRIYNLADDEPCPPQDVITYAAELLGVAPPPEVAFEDASLSAMAKSFYADSKRVSNARIKSELGYTLKYPNYRVGLKALL
ncbi:MAG: SDR family oxidoreductase [Alphaproteobacteria bacterium]|nr:SDR family oxidoreductase [Alphaproteobacteria bacterium]